MQQDLSGVSEAQNLQLANEEFWVNRLISYHQIPDPYQGLGEVIADNEHKDYTYTLTSEEGAKLRKLCGNDEINVFSFLFSGLSLVLSEFSGVAKTVGLGKMKGLNQVTKLSNSVVQGYAVFATTYLYRLNWNDSTANVFYGQYWTNKNAINEERVQAFVADELFALDFIGKQSSFEVVPSVFQTKSYPELIEIATIKATDKSMAKLQRKYPEFQTKTPLYSTNPLTAKIGKKEGVNGKAKFEVLEQVIDKEGRTQYKKRAEIKVDPDKIWDNTYLAGEEGEMEVTIEATHFTGKADKLYSGMLIRQIK